MCVNHPIIIMCVNRLIIIIRVNHLIIIMCFYLGLFGQFFEKNRQKTVHVLKNTQSSDHCQSSHHYHVCQCPLTHMIMIRVGLLAELKHIAMRQW